MFFGDLSSLAALIIVYSLAIDPFAQQLTHFRPERVVVDSAASIPIQSIFSVIGDFTSDAKSLKFHVKRAVKSAFVGSNLPGTLSHCPSGNCSWSSYQSLAVCHQCVDISDLIQINDTCFYKKAANCSAYLENGLTIELGSFDTTRMVTQSRGVLLKIDDVSQSLINFTKLYHDPDDLSPECYRREESITQCLRDIRRKLAATECSLYWCINRYSARQESGVLKENVIDTWWGHSDTDIVSVIKPRDEDTVGEPLGSHIQLIPPRDEVNINDHGGSLGHDDIDPSQGYPSSQRPANYDPCYVGFQTNNILANWLERFFTRNMILVDTRDSQEYDTDDLSIILSGQNKRHSEGKFGVPQLDPVFDIFSNVSFGLTQFIRHDRQSLPFAGKADNYVVKIDGEEQALKLTALGTAFEDRIVVQVRWAWLCFPVGLVAMTVLLTIATKIRGSQQQIPIWGSSTTALMIRGPYSHTGQTSSPLFSADQMYKKAKSTKVTLERSTDGSWRLVERRDLPIRQEVTDLESAVSFLPLSTTYKMREHPKPTDTSTKTTTGSVLAASGTRGREATVATWNPQQRPRLARSQSI